MKFDQKSTSTHDVHSTRIHSVGLWIVLITLFALLVGTMVLSYFASSLAAGIDVPALGMTFCLGAFFSILAGVGLTALVFYSSRYWWTAAS